jgi:hypothetical protein
MTMPDPLRTALTFDDLALLDRALPLLEHVARSSRNCAVGLNAVTAAQLLASAHPSRASLLDAVRIDDRAALHTALQTLAQLSDDALRDDVIADALHHALLAYLAAR